MIQKFKFYLFNIFILSVVVPAFVISSPAHAKIVIGDIVSFWTLDETVAGTYSDAVGGNTGTAATTGAPVPTTVGRFSGAQLFTAADTDGINIPDNNTFDWGVDQSFSIEFWMKGISGTTGESGNEVIVGRDDDATELHWWIGVQNKTSNIVWRLIATNVGGDVMLLEANPAIDVTDEAWHHIVCVRDATNGKVLLYVDSVMTEADETFDAGFDSATQPLNLGWINLSPFYHFNGTLDEVAIYNKALTSTEVQEHFSGLSGPRYVLTDSDGDGMPDSWEQQIIDADPNDTITSIADVLPGDDFDNDGWSNLMEYIRNTDPTDPNSHPSPSTSKTIPSIPLLLLDE